MALNAVAAPIDSGSDGAPTPWREGPVRAALQAGRWHFRHGPIDLVIGLDGEPVAVSRTLEQAWDRFGSLLSELAGELPLLRSPVQAATAVRGPVARRMVAACWPHRAVFVTPMAAVAGAVADELIGIVRMQPGIARAYVNNGGDIAIHLTEGERYRIGLFADIGRIERGERWRLDGDFDLASGMPARGVATSGWRGRSFSLGIADSVTVLARCAAEADAAATLIANAVNIEDAAIVRRPANELKDDSDLGGRLVTVEVGTLSVAAIDAALDAGAAVASRMLEQGLILTATLWLQGRNRTQAG